MMPLWLHIIIHILLSVLAGFIAWSVFKKRKKLLEWSIIAGIVGGVLIDSDHLFDHFMAYGLTFRIYDFFAGTHFVINNKIYVPFHGYEYVVILFVIIFILTFKRKTLTLWSFVFTDLRLKAILLAFTLGMLFHLLFDVYVNDMPWQSYSVLYRINHNFEAPALIKQWSNNN